MGSTGNVVLGLVALGLLVPLKFWMWPSDQRAEALGSSAGLEDRAKDFFQCDRQCRWMYGAFDRNIIGYRRAKAGSIFNADGKYCECYNLAASATQPLDGGKKLARFSKKEFDSIDTWSGDFTSKFVCTSKPQGGLETMLEDDAVKQKREILHCGKCAVCSAKKDAVVLSLSRKWITEVMTAASASFAAPWGHGDLDRLQRNLFDLGMNFSKASQPEFGETSCMECWTDNIMSDANTCKSSCWTKFFKPSNPRVDITNCHPLDLNCKCLKCDEDYSGAQFIKCAGANRRSTGIVSDIARPANQQCKVGMYHGVPDTALPTATKPSKDEIKRILKT